MNLRFSQEIEALLEKAAQEPLLLRDILMITAERSFCFMIALLAPAVYFSNSAWVNGDCGDCDFAFIDTNDAGFSSSLVAPKSC